jgi:uncharacterized protein YjbI with pentapeptide repeats
MTWRTEPEVDTERQRFLMGRRAIKPDIERGIYPFRDANGSIKLARADVEWLLATHESGGMRGPVDWSDVKQQGRKRLDLQQADLSFVHLTGLPLARANLRLTHLEHAQLDEVHLEGAFLCGARLERADLHGAHMERADLRLSHLEQADLRGAHLERATCHAAYAPGACFDAAHLEGAVLPRDLRGASFVNACLAGASLRMGNKLTEAVLRGADLSGAHLEGASLRGADLSGAKLEGAILAGADLTNAKGV